MKTSKRINLFISLGLILCLFGPSSSFAVSTTAPTSNKATTPIKAFHFVLHRMTTVEAKGLVDTITNAGFNTIVVTIKDGVKLNYATWKPTADAWSKSDFIDWVSYAKSRGLNVVPELKLLTHQELLLQRRYPALMFNGHTYDPHNPTVYKTLEPLVNEIIAVTQPSAFHIGHDEAAGWLLVNKPINLLECERMLPAELFLQDVLTWHDFFKKKGIETWMWGDMLVSPKEFPSMLAKHLKGASPGYGKTLRSQIPRDIVINDWHYFDQQLDFPSLATMQAEGFRVIGATWKDMTTTNNFSRYAANHHAYGIMMTTWFAAGSTNTVVINNWSDLNTLIRESSLIFNRDFP
jgi:Glycosyl hydrolase family 20, catalytic domain